MPFRRLVGLVIALFTFAIDLRAESTEGTSEIERERVVFGAEPNASQIEALAPFLTQTAQKRFKMLRLYFILDKSPDPLSRKSGPAKSLDAPLDFPITMAGAGRWYIQFRPQFGSPIPPPLIPLEHLYGEPWNDTESVNPPTANENLKTEGYSWNFLAAFPGARWKLSLVSDLPTGDQVVPKNSRILITRDAAVGIPRKIASNNPKDRRLIGILSRFWSLMEAPVSPNDAEFVAMTRRQLNLETSSPLRSFQTTEILVDPTWNLRKWIPLQGLKLPGSISAVRALVPVAPINLGRISGVGGGDFFESPNLQIPSGLQVYSPTLQMWVSPHSIFRMGCNAQELSIETTLLYLIRGEEADTDKHFRRAYFLNVEDFLSWRGRLSDLIKKSAPPECGPEIKNLRE